MTEDGFDALRRRDEILEVMYWLRGERLGDSAGTADLCVFLGDEIPVLEGDLAALVADGLLEPAAGRRFRLTERGVKEGGRRFADSFEHFQRPGHGECNRPGCVCRRFGPEACATYVGGRT